MTESQTSNSYIDSDFRSERFSARPLSAYSPNRPGCLPPFAIVAARILARAVFRAFARRRRGSRPEDDARVFVATKKSRFHRAAELGHDSRTVHDSRATRESRPVESDPACVKILTELDDATSVLTSPGEALDRALRACVSSDVLAVDLEGVSMSRVGPVTLLQVAARDRVFLFDAQALGTAELFERAVSVDETDENDGPKARTAKKTLRGVLEDGQITKLMFDCRVDSDALFHQHGVALRGVFDVQLADVASRRRKNLAVPLLSGMPKCAARHLSAIR